ncbi:MAG: hypothetical protein ACK5KO_10660 [Arachnia sp.]
MNQKKLAAGIVGGIAATGLVVGGAQLAMAEDDQTTPTPSISSSAQAPGDHSRVRAGRGGGFGLDSQALAKKLGVTSAELDDALEDVHLDMNDADDDDATTSGDRDARHEAMIQALADELDLDPATVRTAMDELWTERDSQRAAEVNQRLDEAVADGTLTQAEADAVRKAVDAGIVSVHGRNS